MTWRASVESDFAAYGVSIYLGQKTDQGLLAVKRINLDYELVPPAVHVEPSLRLEDEAAKAILEALSFHYGGSADTRTLRADYVHERERVDKFINRLLSQQ
jgi:hypothetical protein